MHGAGGTLFTWQVLFEETQVQPTAWVHSVDVEYAHALGTDLDTQDPCHTQPLRMQPASAP